MSTKLASGLGVIAILLWSMSVGLTRSLSESLGPYYAGAAIYTTSSLFVALLLGKPNIRQQNHIYLWGCGSLFVLYMVCFSLAIGFADNHQQSLELALINYLWPSLTLVLALYIQKISARFWIWLGMGISLFGIVWVVSQGQIASLNFKGNILSNPIAYSLALIGALCWALYSNLVRLYSQGKGALVLFLACTSIVLWIIAGFLSHYPVAINLSVISQLAVMGGATALAYLFWDKAMTQGNVTLVTLFSYFTPLISLLVASYWLKTPLAKTFWPGIALVIFGSLLCWHASRKKN